MKHILFLLILSVLISCQVDPNETSRIKEDIAFLANDELEGRQTGTEGEKKAAEYIAMRLEGLGVSSKGTKG